MAADVAAGLTVGVVALPLAMAFAIASGLKPEQGLAAAIVGGFLISALGGSSVQIGGPAGAFIVIVAGIVAQHGTAGLWTATLMAGVLMLLMGVAGLGAWVRRIPGSIVAGFTNGIAVLIMVSQLKDLLGLHPVHWPAEFPAQLQQLWQQWPQASLTALAMGLTTFLGMVLWTRLWQDRLLPRALVEGRAGRTAARVPGAIVALVSTSLITAALGLQVDTLGSRFGGIPSALPTPSWPFLPLALWPSVMLPALTLAALGAIESLLCARVADGLLENQAPHEPNQELMAQGLANAVVPMFAGMPVTGTIARTVTNVRSGGRTPLAGMAHAATLMVIMLVAAPWCLHVPLPALAGILLFVAWNMGEWRDFVKVWRHAPLERWLMGGTFALTVVTDLAVALTVSLMVAGAPQWWAARRRAGD